MHINRWFIFFVLPLIAVLLFTTVGCTSCGGDPCYSRAGQMCYQKGYDKGLLDGKDKWSQESYNKGVMDGLQQGLRQCPQCPKVECPPCPRCPDCPQVRYSYPYSYPYSYQCW